MSKQWWNSSQTTQGHGIYSQYKADHLKEWISREDRKQERSLSPEKSFNERRSFHRSSLFAPIESEPVEHLHHATTKSLSDLRQFQAAPPSGGHVTQYPTSPSVVTSQPLKGQSFLPHLSHHHHFGWNPPTPQAQLANFDARERDTFYKYGSAQRYNNEVHCKSSIISSRRA